MLIRERMIASKIAAKLREQYPDIQVEVNLYTNEKLIIRFRTDTKKLYLLETTLWNLNEYADEEDMISDAVILVKRNIKE